MKRQSWIGLAAALVVVAGTWSLGGHASSRPGPLEPLTWLTGGVWRPVEGAAEEGAAPSRAFEWSSRGLVLRETRTDAEGDVAGEVTYHWHHGKEEIAVYGVLPEAHFEGIVRAPERGLLELQWKLYPGDDRIELYRERLRREGEDSLVRTLRRITENEETLEEETTLVRRWR